MCGLKLPFIPSLLYKRYLNVVFLFYRTSKVIIKQIRWQGLSKVLKVNQHIRQNFSQWLSKILKEEELCLVKDSSACKISRSLSVREPKIWSLTVSRRINLWVTPKIWPATMALRLIRMTFCKKLIKAT